MIISRVQKMSSDRSGNEDIFPGIEGIPLHTKDGPDRVLEYVNGSFIHRLLKKNDRYLHEWRVLKEGEEVDILDLEGEDLLDASIEQLDQIAQGKKGKKNLHFQQFSRWDERVFNELEGERISIGPIMENEDMRIRITAGESRYELQYRLNPRKDLDSSYMISRLNSVSYKNTVDLLGVSYWTVNGINYPWLSITRYRDGAGSGFAPFLKEVNDLVSRAERMEIEELRSFLRKLSHVKRSQKFALAREMGRALGDLHRGWVIDQEYMGRKDPVTEGDRIMKMFSRSHLGMEEVGTYLGRMSTYLEIIKKGLYRMLGDTSTPSVPTGRKQKVLKRSGRELSGPLTGLALLRGSLNKKQKGLRESFSYLRKFKGSPLIPSELDCRLDHVGIYPDGDIIFRYFDWNLFDTEERPGLKILPLKDLALVLSSLNKARYLSARRTFTKITGSRDITNLNLMYLDYNLAKNSYISMTPDLAAVKVMSGKHTPFRAVVIASIVSELWFERSRNALITGYNEALSNSGRDDLLIYPRGVDTLEGIKLMQRLTSLSSAATTFHRGSEKNSILGLEADLLTVLSV